MTSPKSVQDQLAELCESVERASRIKQSLTGAPLEYEEIAKLKLEDTKRADFKELLGAFYIVWKDRWERDRSLFTRKGDELSQFDMHFLALRTPFFHRVDPDSQAYCDKWLEEHGGTNDWNRRIGAFLDEALDAIKTLQKRFQSARANSELILRWRLEEADTPRSAILAMSEVLGIKIGEKQLSYKVRSLAQRLEKFPPRRGQDLANLADVYAIRELVSWFGTRPLSLGYLEMLEEFDLVGDPRAREFIWLMHAVEGVSKKRMRGDLVEIIRGSWQLMTEK
jgi:hypothetical protein